MTAPDEIKYTEEHEWVRRTAEDRVRIGITDYAQQQLGDVVFVQLPELGRQVAAGDPMGEVESTKSVSEIYAPVTGEVVARNEQLEDEPELVNSAPLDDGWMVELRLADPAQLTGLLDAEGYRKLTDQA
ncbi:glycine cleavage system protein GcvH [Saccharopolyspora phatthalungensis]|uniref:Glycine cleavage system H protein n=1 Tax=Saccharopolyspora phatthalungensis TaxID=664693 RepID=A0A840Q5V9_9PSEU|nr:glycine cleavage system protein GcvH [Saccharopolyspora phatthalungensis]MBB5157892.1 glycine cleavage system H protein [Saccharopolyspora phatthalungensis]